MMKEYVPSRNEVQEMKKGISLGQGKWWNWARPCGAPGHGSEPCYLRVGNRLQPPSSPSFKGQILTVANQGREGMQRQWRSSHEALGQRPGIFELFCKAKVLCTQSLSHVRLWDPMDCSPPGSSVHGILQAIILQWVAMSFSRGSSRHKDQTRVSYSFCIGRQVYLLLGPSGKPLQTKNRQQMQDVAFFISEKTTWGQIKGTKESYPEPTRLRKALHMP